MNTLVNNGAQLGLRFHGDSCESNRGSNVKIILVPSRGLMPLPLGLNSSTRPGLKLF